MDTLEIVRAKPTFEPMMHIYINGRNLIDMVREIEASFIRTREVDSLTATKHEKYFARHSSPGAYAGLPAHLVYYPSDNLLGRSTESSFCHPYGQAMLFCYCGFAECQSICAKIRVSRTHVTWSGFAHRWNRESYAALGTFTFERGQYFNALLKCDLYPPPTP